MTLRRLQRLQRLRDRLGWGGRHVDSCNPTFAGEPYAQDRMDPDVSHALSLGGNHLSDCQGSTRAPFAVSLATAQLTYVRAATICSLFVLVDRLPYL